MIVLTIEEEFDIVEKLPVTFVRVSVLVTPASGIGLFPTLTILCGLLFIPSTGKTSAVVISTALIPSAGKTSAVVISRFPWTAIA